MNTSVEDLIKQTINSHADELESVIGNDCSDNYSPTLRSKLISIDREKGLCTLEIMPSVYDQFNENDCTVGQRYEQSISIVYNGYFA